MVLDTSVLIAGVAGEIDLSGLIGDGTGAISAVTLCELHHGVMMASDEERAARLLALDIAQRKLDAIPVDARIAPRFGELMAKARRANNARPDVADTLIAATGRAYELPVLTRDQDFEAFQDVEVVFI